MVRLAPFYESHLLGRAVGMAALPSTSPWRLLVSPLPRRGSTMRPAHAAVARYVRGLRPSGFAGNRVIALKFIQASGDFYWSRGSSPAFHRREVTRVRPTCKPRILGVALPAISGPNIRLQGSEKVRSWHALSQRPGVTKFTRNLSKLLSPKKARIAINGTTQSGVHFPGNSSQALVLGLFSFPCDV
jgi:hypothetical protein